MRSRSTARLANAPVQAVGRDPALKARKRKTATGGTSETQEEGNHRPRRSKRIVQAGAEANDPHETTMCFSSLSQQIRICISGYSYKHWHEEGSFYSGIPARLEFETYAKQFDCVELNATFYGWFSEEIFDRWRERASSVRPTFQYVVKASKMYTHKKRLHTDDFFKQSWVRFWDRCCRLGKHLGPVLFQLPENFKLQPTPKGKGDVLPQSNLALLDLLGSVLPQGRFVFEFRHASWFCPQVYQVLKKYDWCLALVEVSGAGLGDDEDQDWCQTLHRGPNPSPEAYPLDVCSWGVYVRFHGTGGKYCGAYGPKRMQTWAKQLHAWALTGRQVYAAFNNTDDGLPPSAIADARSIAAALRDLGAF